MPHEPTRVEEKRCRRPDTHGHAAARFERRLGDRHERVDARRCGTLVVERPVAGVGVGEPPPRPDAVDGIGAAYSTRRFSGTRAIVSA